MDHNCGLCVAHTLHDVYSFIKSLQHRGREATGIAAISNKTIDVIKWEGPVTRFDIVDLYKILSNHDYHTYMAHVRYATRGRKDKLLEDAHPHTIGGKPEKRGSHMILRDCDIAIVHNGQIGSEHFEKLDKTILKTECDTEALIHIFKEKSEHGIIKDIKGAYTLAIADKRRKDVIVMRDCTGMKPGLLCWKDGKYGIASEDIAFKENGGKFIEDIEPGFIYYLASNGSYRKEKAAEQKIKHCFFEWNYIADLDSIINGVSVRSIRNSLGEIVADEFNPEDVDVVTFLPRCPEAAARSYAKKSGKPFEFVFYKTRGERSFQGSDATERKKSIDENLFLIPGVEERLQGKTVLMMDDSIVRGNNSRRARDLLYDEAKVKKAYLVSYTPQIGIVGKDGIERGCLFGVDMPPDDKFIARNRSVDEISMAMNIEVHYISTEGMLKAFERAGLPGQRLCTYCIGGSHPFS
jgi:amidophosphoribosyltransferase